MPGRVSSFSIASALLLAFAPIACDGDDGGTSSGTTAGDHGADEHGGSTADHDHTVDTTGGQTPAEAYCACVFAACHEDYHAKWGEDEVASREACLAEAEALPVNGAPIEMGNFLECRQYFCDEAATDASLCANALGDAVCM